MMISEGVTITLVLPRRCVEWLDLQAVKRKHTLGQGKPAKAPIVAALIEREMARLDAPAQAEPKPKPAKKGKEER